MRTEHYKLSWHCDISLSIGEYSHNDSHQPSNGAKCFISLTLMIYCRETTINPEFSFYRQIYKLIVVFFVKGILLTLLCFQVSSDFVKACLIRSKVYPPQTINFMDSWFIMHLCQWTFGNFSNNCTKRWSNLVTYLHYQPPQVGDNSSQKCPESSQEFR